MKRIKHDNEMTLVVKAQSQNEAFSRSVVAAFCSQLDPTIEEINDIKTAVSEAVTNSIVHAYQRDSSQDISIFVAIDDNQITITVSDTGKGINNVNQALQPFFTTRPQDERSGMGFTVMQAFMDELNVTSVVDKGTTVFMTKKINSSKAQDNA